jgi:predicted  nucleic acid-binding Zn-ribbon protein
LRQHDWHTAVTKDFQDAHSRIEAQVKGLREKAHHATAITKNMIEQEVFKMNALSENMLNRLNVLTEQHDEVQLALRDVVARQKDVKRASQRMSGRVSDAGVVTAVSDMDVASERSTEPPFSSQSSRRCNRDRQSSSDEAGGLDEHTAKIKRQLKVLTSKFHASKQREKKLQECRERSSSRESSHLHRRMNHMSSRIRNAQASATHVHKSVTQLETRQDYQELLSSAVMQELVCILKWGLQNNQDEQVHGVTEEQILARALLWQLLSNHEKRLASA